MRYIIRLIDRLSGAAGWVAAGLLVPLILVTCYEVLARYLFNAPTSWGYEIGYTLTGLSFILGCAYALREGAHIRIDIIANRLPPRLQAGLMAFLYLMFLPAVWWISYGLLDYALEAFQTGERSGQSAWNPVVWPFRFGLGLGFMLLSLQVTAEFFKALCVAAGGPGHYPPKPSPDMLEG